LDEAARDSRAFERYSEKALCTVSLNGDNQKGVSING